MASNYSDQMLNHLFHFLFTAVFAQGGTRSTPRRGASFLVDTPDPFADAQPGSIFGRVTKEYDPAPISNELPNPLGIENVNQLADKVISAITQLAVPVVIAMVLWGAFLIVTSGGNPERLKKGGNTIMWAAVGFGILLLAGGAVQIINSIFT